MREVEEDGGKNRKHADRDGNRCSRYRGEKKQLSMEMDYHYRVALDTMRWPVYSRIHFWLDTKRFYIVSFSPRLLILHHSRGIT